MNHREAVRKGMRNAGLTAMGLGIATANPVTFVYGVILGVLSDRKNIELWTSGAERQRAEAEAVMKHMLRQELLHRRLDASDEKLSLWLRLIRAYLWLTSDPEEFRRRRGHGRKG